MFLLIVPLAGIVSNRHEVDKILREGWKAMKRKIVFALILAAIFVLAACGGSGSSSGSGSGPAGTPQADYSNEVYVWACQYNSLPLFVNNDYIGMDLIAEELGVTVKKIGPQEIDLPAFIASVEQEIPNRPNGMMVVGWDASLKVPIDKAIDAGIPVVTVDADVPDSKRLCFVGTDWTQLGEAQARAAAPYLANVQGKAVCIGLTGADNNIQALNGYTNTLKRLAPGISVVQQIYASQSNAQVVAETIANLLKSDPTIVAIAGFDSASGPGIGQAIKEAGLRDKVIGTCVDAEAEHLQNVKENNLKAAVGQKRIFFTYYGVRMLFDYNHNRITYTTDDKRMGITPIPATISTGFITVTPENVQVMIDTAAAKAK
jgi:ABC-type sugar transport system substrate-binding protein